VYEFQWWAVRKLGGQPPGGKAKRGADRGQDGEIFIETQDEFRRRHRVIISVKSGGTPGVKWVTELADAVNNPVHKAYMGILVTLEEPTRNLRTRAHEYGPVSGSADGKSDPYKIQMVSAADLLRLGLSCITLPGLNVTPPWRSELPIPEREEQRALPVDQKPQKDRRRIATLVSDNTGKVARRTRKGPVKTAETPEARPQQAVIPGSGDSFGLTLGRKK
jgi:hypothetical protein